MGIFVLKRKTFGAINPGVWNIGGRVSNAFKLNKEASAAKTALDNALKVEGATKQGTDAWKAAEEAKKAYDTASAASTAANKGVRNSVLTYGAVGGTAYGVGSYVNNKYDTMTGEKFENNNFKKSDWGI